MTHEEILSELKSLSLDERLEIAEEILRLVKQEVSTSAKPRRRASTRAAMEAAAKTLLEDYRLDSELTAFTALDDEDFHASG